MKQREITMIQTNSAQHVPTDEHGFQYRDLTPTQRARLANTSPAKHREMKDAWERAGRPSARTISSAALIRAGFHHSGVAFRDLSWTQRAKFQRENPEKYATLKDQWIMSGRPAPESSGPEAA